MDDAGNEATERLADSVEGEQGRVKTFIPWIPDILGEVEGKHGRVKTLTLCCGRWGNTVELMCLKKITTCWKLYN